MIDKANRLMVRRLSDLTHRDRECMTDLLLTWIASGALAWLVTYDERGWVSIICSFLISLTNFLITVVVAKEKMRCRKEFEKITHILDRTLCTDFKDHDLTKEQWAFLKNKGYIF